jgi:hypothetical protein
MNGVAHLIPKLVEIGFSSVSTLGNLTGEQSLNLL